MTDVLHILRLWLAALCLGLIALISLPGRAEATIDCGSASSTGNFVIFLEEGRCDPGTGSPGTQPYIDIAALVPNNVYKENTFDQAIVNFGPGFVPSFEAIDPFSTTTQDYVQCLSTDIYPGTSHAPCGSQYACRWGFPCDWEIRSPSTDLVVRFTSINEYITNVIVTGALTEVPPVQPLNATLSHAGTTVAPGEPARLTYSLSNPNFDYRHGATAVNFTHDLKMGAAAGHSVIDSILSQPAAGFCGTNSSAQISADFVLSVSNIELARLETCEFSVIYRLREDAAMGSYEHRTSAIGQSFGELSAPLIGASAAAQFDIVAAPDTTPPTISVSDTEMYMINAVIQSWPTPATVSDDRDVDWVKYYHNGLEIDLATHVFAAASGAHRVEVRAQDLAGNTASEFFTVQVHSVHTPTVYLSELSFSGFTFQGGYFDLRYRLQLPHMVSPLDQVTFTHSLAAANSGFYFRADKLPSAPCGPGSRVNYTDAASITVQIDTLAPGVACEFIVRVFVELGASTGYALIQTGAASGLYTPLGETITGASGVEGILIQPGSNLYPEITLTPPTITVDNDPGQGTAYVDYASAITATASDAEDGDLTAAIFTASPNGNTFPIGTNTIIYRVIDSVGSFTFEYGYVTVNDVDPPVLTPPPGHSVSPDPGSSLASFYPAGLGSVTDNGPTVPAISYYVEGVRLEGPYPFPEGQTTVEMRAQDDAGNAAVPVSFVLTVVDVDPPVITHPGTITLSLPGGASHVRYDVTAEASAIDNSGETPAVSYAIGGAAITGPYNFPIGDTVVTLFAQDSLGNAAQDSMIVTVKDTVAPLISVAPLMAPLPVGQSRVSLALEADVSDDSGAVITPVFSLAGTPITSPHSFDAGMHHVDVTATDPTGNIGQAQIAVAVFPNMPLELGAQLSGGVLLPGAPVTYAVTLTNPNGVAISGASFDAILGSAAAGPSAPQGLSLTYLGAGGGCTGSFSANPSSDGLGLAGGGVTIPANSSCTVTGQVSIEASTPEGAVAVFGHTAYDTVGGSVPSAPSPLEPIYVGLPPDTVEPALTLPADITLPNAPGLGTAAASFAVTALDDRDGDLSGAVVLSHASGSDFPIGATRVDVAVSDAAGNTASGAFTVTVEDVEPPLLTPPTDQLVSTGANNLTALIDLSVLGTASDNSGLAPAILYSIDGAEVSSPHEFPLGATLVTMNAQDGAGHPAQPVSFTITVEDQTPPTIALWADRFMLGAGQIALIRFTLSEPSTEFTLPDVVLSGGTMADFTGTGAVYEATFTPDPGTGTAQISVPSAAFTDAMGNANADGDEADNTLTLHFDSDSPTAVISDLTGPGGGTYEAIITLSEPSGDFTADDLDLVNATATLTGSAAAYALRLTPLAEGLVSVSVKAASFTDAFGNSNAAASNTVSATHDTTAPEVAILGLPESFADGAQFAVTIQFSEPVTGFEPADIALSNASLSGFAGSGAVYTFALSATGAGDVTVLIPADRAHDAAGNGNAASEPARARSLTIEETQAQLAEFIASRSNLLMMNQPALSCHLQGGCGRGGFTFSATNGAMFFAMTSRKDARLWFTLSGTHSREEGRDNTYVFGAMGSHRQIRDTLLLGAMVEVDHVASRDGDGRLEGSGWMAGPYLVGKLPNHPLYYEGRLLAGETYNRISPFNSYTDRFTTQRLLSQLAVSGALEYGALVVTPRVSATYATDRQRAYIDALGNLIGAQTAEIYQAEFGLSFEKPTEVMEHPWTVTGGVSAVYSGSRTRGGAAQGDPAFVGARARLNFAARTELRNGSRLNLGLSYDGIGTASYEAIGLELGYQLAF